MLILIVPKTFTLDLGINENTRNLETMENCSFFDEFQIGLSDNNSTVQPSSSNTGISFIEHSDCIQDFSLLIERIRLILIYVCDGCAILFNVCLILVSDVVLHSHQIRPVSSATVLSITLAVISTLESICSLCINITKHCYVYSRAVVPLIHIIGKYLFVLVYSIFRTFTECMSCENRNKQ